MRSLVAEVVEILGPARRRRLVALIGWSAIGSIADAMGVALIFVVVRLATDPEAVAGGRWAAALYAFSGAASPLQFATRLGVAVLLLFVAKSVYGAGLHYVQCAFCSHGVADLATRLYRGYLATDYAALQLRHSAELVRNVRELANHVYYEVVMALLAISVEVMVLAGLTGVLLVLQPLPTVLAGTLLIAVFLMQSSVAGKLGTGLGRQYLSAAGGLQKSIQEGLGGLKETKILGRESDAVASFAREQKEFARIVGRQLFVSQVHRHTNEVAVLLAVTVVVALTLSGDIGGGPMLAPLAMFAAAAFRMVPAVNRIMYNVNVLRHYRPSVTEMLQELRAFDERSSRDPDRTDEGGRLPFRRELACIDVSYTYPLATQPALDEVTFTIRRGTSVGIVGESGAGKSTLADVLLGLLVPTRGRVLVDGIDIAAARRPWQRNLGYVPRHVYVADDSVRHNVALGIGDSDIDDERLRAVLRIAHLEEFVASLPEGVETRLGERGARLSDGQRQRVGIARALYRDPEVLVFDEATAALDVAMEHALTETIRDLKGRTTFIVIAHRLNTVKACEEVLLMERGRLADVGTLHELAERNPGFSRALALADLSAYHS